MYCLAVSLPANKLTTIAITMINNYLLHPCQTEKEMTAAVKLRYIAYKNVNAINENAKEEFTDKYDLLVNSNTCLVYEENAPVASMRACIYSKERAFMELPSFEVYRHEIEKEIGLDKTILECNRFVIHPEKVDSKQLFKIPFRFIILNALKFNSDYIISAVRPKHIPLYKRFFGFEPISSPKRYPGLNVEMILMMVDCIHLPKVMDKEDIFKFTEDEVRSYLPKSGPFPNQLEKLAEI